MLELFDKLGWACKPAAAATHGFAFGTDSIRATNRAAIRKDKFLGIMGTFFDKHANHLGNDIASTLDNDMIAYTNIFALYLILIMQGCVRYDDAANRDG